MSALQFELPDRRVIDLFAGSGALGLEALSRGAAHATFVETWPRAIEQLKANIETLGAAGQTSIVRADALEYVARIEAGEFDVALADPPYGQGFAAGLLEHFAKRPFATTLWVEHRSDEPLPDLPGARTRRYGDTSITSIPAES
jgi:16S rRNA (guanine966-N2)-methyltransferase